MTQAKVTLSRVQYAPEVPGFVALARVHDGGMEYSYPVQMAAPLTAEVETVARGLTRRGLSAHRNATTARLRMVRPDLSRLTPGLGLQGGIAA